MKNVVMGNEMYNKMEEAINLLCDTVKNTLGPKGTNAIINKTTFSPFITNDGVTIAENIESNDIVVNTILEIAKEASIKTNETVGDGTTTTLVLLQSIFNNGLELIRKGENPIVLKRKLEISLEKIIEKILKYSKKPNNDELKKIAIVSANDLNIGNVIYEAYLKTKNKEAITIKEGDIVDNRCNYLDGYILESNLASNYFLKDLKEINYSKAFILLIDNYLDNIECITDIINFVIRNNKNLVIYAKDFDDFLINEIISLNIDNNINIVLLKNPEYGKNQISILKDLSAISNAKIIEKLDYIDTTHLGIISKIKITNDKTVISFQKNVDVERRIIELEKELKNESDNFFIKKRLAMFTNGIVEIIVGDKTTTARREKKMRYDDSLCAVFEAEKGVLPGSGLILLKISNELEISDNVDLILKNALKNPFEQILFNAGLEKKYILKKIEENNFNIVYNLNNMNYENIEDTNILDATSVVVNSLISSISIASMLLSTSCIVVNEHNDIANKCNDYNVL